MSNGAASLPEMRRGSRVTAIRQMSLGKITSSGVASSHSLSSCGRPNGYPYRYRGLDTFSKGALTTPQTGMVAGCGK